MRSINVNEAAFDVSHPGARRWSVAIPDDRGGQRLTVFTAGDGAGPTLLVTGGVHGDEFEGQVAVLELARALPSLTINGRMIVVPFVNEAACRASQRTSPVDGRDLNRLFSVDRQNGAEPSTQLARFVEERLLPGLDWLIDLHSGGRAHEFVLSSNLQASPGTAECEAMMPALLAFDAPYAIVFDEAGPHAMPHRGTLESAARARGTRALSSELGGAGRLTAPSLSVARQGLVNLLHHIGSVRSPRATDWRESRSRLLSLTRPDEHVAAGVDGWFCPTRVLGESVEPGDVIGYLMRDEDPFAEPAVIRSATDGIIVALAAKGRMTAQERVAYVASLMQRQRQLHGP